MTAQEQQLISGLADRIGNAPAPQIDRDAYDLILHTIGTRPDALYILTQTVLMQEMALNQLKAQSAPPQGGFLPGSQGYQGSSYGAPPSGGGMFSNFLHNAATTAAGVIAGEIAFDSLSSIFGHRGGFFGGGGGSFFDGGSGILPGSETVDDSRFADAASQDQNISPDIDDERDNSGDDFSGGDDGGSSDS